MPFGKNQHDLIMKPRQQLTKFDADATARDSGDSTVETDEVHFLVDAHIGHWVWERNGSHPLWSRQIYRMLGIHPDERPLTVERYCAHVHARHARQVEALFRDLKEGRAEAPVALTHTLVSADGQERLLVLRGDVVLADSGQPLRYAGSIEQLGERGGSDASFKSVRLLDAQRRFEQAFRYSHTPRIIVTLTEGRVVRANPACLRLFAMPIEELRGRSTLALGFWKDAVQWKDFVDRVEKQGQANGVDTRVQTPGGVLDIVLSGYEIDWMGEPHILLELQDVTARRRFEASFYLGAIPTGVSSMNDGVFIDVNDAYLDMLGYTREQLIGKSCVELGVWQSPQEWEKVLEALRREGSVRSVEAKLVRSDGEIREVLFFAQAVELQEQSCFLSQVRDITERKRAERRLRLAAATLEHLGEALLIADSEKKIISSNPAFTRMTGHALEDVLGRPLPELLGQPGMQQNTLPFQHMMEAAERDQVWEGEVWTRRKNGEVFPQRLILSTVRDAGGNTLNYVAVLNDITQHKEYEAQLKYIAYHDALTSLPNRKLLVERCHQAILRAQRTGGECAVLYLDLDNFKPINDTYGHEVGDKLLQEVALRMQHCVRATDTVARLGGDEFVVLLDGLGSRQNAVAVAQKMVADLSQPFRIDTILLFISASVGIAVWPEHGSDVDILLRRADKALYKAKQSGRSRYRLADPDD
jgi:diguanylate cyclase (GGDEF)-like protein/PAS domain S-box-containing protein